MNEEIEKNENNNTSTLVLGPKDKNVIGTKWVFENKLNENGEVTRNKERLVCKGYAQEEGVDYGETFSPMERLEGVKNLLAYSSYKNFELYHMDVKSTFLNGILEEEVYIEQPKGFVDLDKKNMVCKLNKTLYGFKQAPLENGIKEYTIIWWRSVLKGQMITIDTKIWLPHFGKPI